MPIDNSSFTLVWLTFWITL